MIGDGRPLRFLALLLGSWAALRVFLLWPPVEAIVETVAREARGGPPVVAVAVIPLGQPEVSRVVLRLPARSHRVVMAIPDSAETLPAVASDDPAYVMLARPWPAQSILSQVFPLSERPVGRAPLPGTPRWTASAWLVARGEGNAALAPGGTLGGSQAGLRVAYRPLRDAPVALFARVSRPLRMRGAEAALGIEAQPFARIPVRAALEQRFALEDGAAEGTALSLIGGVGEVPLAGRWRLDAYGQAGIIGLRRRIGFIDGAASITRPIASWGDTDLLLGAGLWGAAQPGLSRFDLGPRAEVRVPIARQRVRLGLEWRQRISGNARPGSGPTVTLGADF